MLRVIARSMILWDEVDPTCEWIDQQIPKIIRDAFQQMKADAEKEADLNDILGGLDKETKNAADETNELQGGQEAASASEGDIQSSTRTNQDQNREKQKKQIEQEIDKQAVRQAHAYIICGACFGIALRFAGTANKRAAATITQKLLLLKGFRDRVDHISASLKPENQIVEMCLGACSVSLAMVLAGSGDLDALRLFNMLRWKCEFEIRYGTHMAFNSAIGLLFLGGGRCTLGRSMEDIAVLAASFFPRFPSTTADNQFHLQAMRHFYVMATKNRLVQAIDSDSGLSIPVELQVRWL